MMDEESLDQDHDKCLRLLVPVPILGGEEPWQSLDPGSVVDPRASLSTTLVITNPPFPSITYKIVVAVLL